MSPRARVVRTVNFAFPWSERDQYFMPGTVRILVGASALIVLLLVALPFYLQQRTRAENDKRGDLTIISSTLRGDLEGVAPVLVVKARLDSLQAALEERVTLYSSIAATDYPVDRLLLHLAEILPEGMVLNALSVKPFQASQGGRAGLQPQTAADLPEEVKNLWVLTLQGTTRNAPAITTLVEKLRDSPLFYLPQQQSVNPVAGTARDLTFTITARLPGSGNKLEAGGGS